MTELTFTGKENEVKAFTSVIDRDAIKKALILCREPQFSDSKIRLMPNMFFSKSGLYGFTMTISDAVIPLLMGDDLGCGTLAVKLSDADISQIDDEMFQQAVSRLGTVIPQKVIRSIDDVDDRVDLSELRCEMDYDDTVPIAGLGSDIRFAELDKASDGSYYLIIKAGSSVIGSAVLAHYTELAEEANDGISFVLAASAMEKGDSWDAVRSVEEMADLKDPFNEFEKKILTDTDMEDFIHDASIAQAWGALNRSLCADAIIKYLGLHKDEKADNGGEYDCPSHFIDKESMVLRCDAIDASAGKKVIIPLNAVDGCLLCEGVGNEEWNCSAPSCAGRILDNSDAEELLAPMSGGSKINGFPNKQAYRPSEITTESICADEKGNGTVKVLQTLVPVYTCNNI